MTKRLAPTVDSTLTITEPLENGTYPAILVHVEDTIIAASAIYNKPERDGFYLTLAVFDPDAEDADEQLRFLRRKVAVSFYENGAKQAALTGALKAMGITPPKNGESYDDDDWLGGTCEVTLNTYEGKKPDGTTSGVFYNGIQAFSPLRAAKKKQADALAEDAREAYATYAAERQARIEQREMATAGAGQPNF